MNELAGSVIVGNITFCMCLFGVCTRKQCGMRLADKAVGGVILIAVGLEIVIIG